ncbi:MAG TPA: cation:proton antiporter [Gammaproteobacteria bacterium]|nr:cation:proton antiporter [Gammaproteobacteria bacterium]
MTDHSIIFSIFLIFSGATLLATLALFIRQSMLVAYILVGIMAGPWGFHLVTDLKLIGQIAEVGIIFLLFLLGMNLEPQDLARLFRKTTIVTLVSSALFFGAGFGLSLLFGLSAADSAVIGICMMFSSTIIGLKLLPTTALHHQHMGELLVSILLLQDIVAVLALAGIQGFAAHEAVLPGIARLVLALAFVTTLAFLVSRYLLHRLITRFDRIHEYIFLLTIGWCLGISQLANFLGLGYEIGAFIGGVSLAISPIARFITEHLKPLRDFFLVMFFFTLGAGFNIGMLAELIVPAGALALFMLVIKPQVFRLLLRKEGEKSGFSTQCGYRLGQVSEFSLLIAIIALQAALISERASYLIQITTLLTFIVSSYYIVMRYPTPIAVDDHLRKD